MPRINPKNIVKSLSEIAAESNKTAAKGLDAFASREMEMVPKYLELASLNGKDRFSSINIHSITKSFGGYETNLSKTNVLKDLLAIGNENGSPLTKDEIIGFLNATSGMKPKEQRNVLSFVKTSKEFVPKDFSVEEYKKCFTYDKFKARYLKIYGDTPLAKALPDFLSDQSIRKSYDIAVENTIRIHSNPYYQKALNGDRINPADYILKHPNKGFIDAVSKSSDPEKLLGVINAVGVNNNTIAAAEDLLQLFNLSKNNIGLISDVARDFYPAEIKQIAEVLSSEMKAGAKQEVVEYMMLTSKFSDGRGLSSERYNILKALGINGKIKMLPLRTYMDAYNPMSKITGNYEGGKKR